MGQAEYNFKDDNDICEKVRTEEAIRKGEVIILDSDESNTKM